MDNFHFFLVRIVADYENLLCLKLFMVYFDFVQIFEYLSEVLLFLVNLHNCNYVLEN